MSRAEMIYLTTNNIPLLTTLADLLVLSLSFLQGLCPLWERGERQVVSREASFGSREKEDEKAPGSNPAPHYPIIYYASN